MVDDKDDKLDKILAAIEEVQKTQKEEFGKINLSLQLITRTICGPFVELFERIEEKLDLQPRTNWSDKLDEIRKSIPIKS